jgi:molybdopterin-synthase adenylyltransferase
MAMDHFSPALTESDYVRYRRQMLLPGWGEAGQQKLKGARVFVAGAGGLGSPASIYLAVAGVGEIIICDFDCPELSNLNRQILHDDSRLGVNKAESAKQTLAALNPAIRVQARGVAITAENVDELVADADIIVDALDNFPIRFVLNECARRKGIPLVHGSLWGMEGRLAFLHSPETACLRCLVAEAPPPETFPVVGATAGVIGALQALETLKYLTGVGSNLKGKQLVWDGASMSFNFYPIRKDPNCPVCGGQ